MTAILRNAVALAAVVIATQATAQIVFYEREGFEGRSFTTEEPVRNLERFGFNDRASSVIVLRDRWEACEDARFRGHCIVLRPGRYPSLAAMGLNDRVSSVQMVNGDEQVREHRYAPEPQPVYDNHRRNHERLFEANITSVRAVVGPPEQRCWMEREEVRQEVTPDRSNANVPGAIIGAVIGGVLGHQVGGGTGKDIATVGGAVAGGVVGANVGRDRSPQMGTRDVQRCTSTPSQARPEYWDVTYTFEGLEHRIQMTTPPGATITVNREGEPRA